MLRPKTYIVLLQAVSDGVKYGVRRSFKHQDNPSQEVIIDQVTESVVNSVLEWFGIDNEEDTEAN